jgi:hypothetical protein
MENQPTKRKTTAFKATFVVVFLVVIPLLYVFITKLKEAKCEYYRKGLQMGLESAEESCYKFNEDEYVGSLGWIEAHNPKLYSEIKNGEIGDFGCIGFEQSFLEKLLGN